MKDSQIKNRIQKLREEISRLRFLYHVEDAPWVTDDVYDSLNKELRLLLEKNPEYIDLNAPENRVGGKPLDKFVKVKHEIRMLSMNDVFSFGEVLDWETRISKLINKKHSYFCELKLDGLSASLIYKDGVFVEGSTRGDGFIGEDVTENLKMIVTVPLKLKAPYPSYLEVRGEVVMPKRILISLNKKQIKEGKQPFANTRNAAAGSLRQLDPNIAKERNLDFFAWDVAQLRITNEELKIKNHSEKHNLLRGLGFQVAPYEKKANSFEEVFSFIEEIEKIRPNLPYGTDGVVVSVDEIELQDVLGVVGKAPRYMVAYKYQAERATTTLKDISVNVGRTGVLTPVAHFNPTLVAGSTVSKATLHNMDQINRLDIRTGDTVVIQKAGDVIPEVVEVLINLRNGKEKKFKMPDTCPVCDFKVEKRSGPEKNINLKSNLAGLEESPMRGEDYSLRGPTSKLASEVVPLKRGMNLASKVLTESVSKSVAFYCTNKNCPARSRRGLQHFVNIFEIYEIGPRILDRLKDEGLVSDGADLFVLEKADLAGLERFGEKSADNIISSIQSHKKISLWRFIYSLGIIHVGEQTARDLADNFGSLNKIMSADIETINKIANIGPVVSQSVFNYFKDKTNLHFIEKLIKNGVSIYHEKAKSLKLSGKIFVLTGTLSALSRNDAKKKIIELGGSVASSVSSNTSYVVAGDKPGSKYNDAKKLGIKVLTENEFLKLI
ncbi:MAG: NAD-dependent DNA ligase LigA [Candidatus Pacebacteria bacterium]|nr:NAD-dependent DNA ligase LigA [Candidatus Paceibacterota bacterium]